MSTAYLTHFNTSDHVSDIEEANAFFKEACTNLQTHVDVSADDGSALNEVIKRIMFEMTASNKGTIQITCERELTKGERIELSNWLGDECAEGIGDEFGDQDFANYYVDSNGDVLEGDAGFLAENADELIFCSLGDGSESYELEEL